MMEEESMEKEDEVITCIMCKNKTYQNFYHKHLRFHHMIQDAWLIDMVAELKGPPNIPAEIENTEIPTGSVSLEKVSKPGPARRLGRPPKIKKVVSGGGDGARLDRDSSPLPKSDHNDSRCAKVKSTTTTTAVTNKGALTIKIKTQNGTMYSEVKEKRSKESGLPTSGSAKDSDAPAETLRELISLSPAEAANGASQSFPCPEETENDTRSAGSKSVVKQQDQLNQQTSHDVTSAARGEEAKAVDKDTSEDDSREAGLVLRKACVTLERNNITTTTAGSTNMQTDQVEASAGFLPQAKVSLGKNSSPGSAKTRGRPQTKQDGLARSSRGSRGRASSSGNTSPVSRPEQTESIAVETEKKVIVEIDLSSPKIQEKVCPSTSEVSLASLTRYRCSLCKFTDTQKGVVAVHAAQRVCSGDAVSTPTVIKQAMRLVLDVVPNIMETISENDLICLLDPARFAWVEADATLPAGWKRALHTKRSGAKILVYLSAAQKIYVSRQQVADHFEAEGVRLAEIAGYKVHSGTDATSHSSDDFVVPEAFYAPSDPNRRRKNAKLAFFPDYEIEKEYKIRDKNPRNLERTTYANSTVTFFRPQARTERPRIMLLQTGSLASTFVKKTAGALKKLRGPHLKRKHVELSDSPSHPLRKRLKIRKSIEEPERDTKRLESKPLDKERLTEDQSRQPEPSKPDLASQPDISKPDAIKDDLNEASVEEKPAASDQPMNNGSCNGSKQVEENWSKRNVRGGTDAALYIQCCNKACKRWRQVKEFKDASEVPDYWVCSMNRDTLNRVCGKGGSHFSGSGVNVKFPRGTLVWGKLKGYPWWPGMIDRNPDCDEFYWIDEKISCQDPTRYNVIFFEKDNEVSSAWLRTESIRPDQDKAPSINIVLSQEIKANLAQAMKMVDEARRLSVPERLDKFSLSKDRAASRNSFKSGKPDLATDASTSKMVPNDKPMSSKGMNKSEPQVVEIENIKPEQLFSKCNPSWEKVYNKPPLPSDVLITLAVRNLDPQNHSGASFSSIVAFLSLHFPYYNRNIEECKDMVRKAYDINSKEETGRENFRIKNSLIATLSERINTYINKYRSLVQEAMLINQFLDTLIERFVKGSLDIPAKNVRPPYSLRMLINLSLVSLYPPISLEQIYLFLTFLFPYISEPQDKSAFKREDFLKEMDNDENITVIRNKKGERFYLLREGAYPTVLAQVRSFFSTKSNFVRFNKSIYKPEFIHLLLPNLSEA